MLLENIKMALSALLANKLRSFLTMLGIIIGIGSVIAITSIGDTIKGLVASIYEDVGKTQLFVYMNVDEHRTSDLFTPEEARKFMEVFEGKLVYIDFNSSRNADVKTKLGTHKVNLQGVGADFIGLQPMEMLHGRFLNRSDISESKHVCVIEDTAAEKMFGTENAVGRSFRVPFYNDITEFTVVGVYQMTLSPMQKALLGGAGNDLTSQIMIPASMFDVPEWGSYYMMRCFANTEFTTAQIQDFQTEFRNYIARTKGRTPEEVKFYSVVNEMEQVNGFLGAVSVAIGGIAAISLLVGGIGIMNIMLVSVTERTREIGTRKALGATTGDILTQFLVESAFLSAIGGMIGIAIAVGLVSLAGAAFGQRVVVKPLIVLIAVGFSALVGVFFGIYPALKAAKRDPIVALRYE